MMDTLSRIGQAEAVLRDWGAKFHDLLVGDKPHFDLYICDKSVNSESYFKRQKFHVTHTSFSEEDYGFHL